MLAETTTDVYFRQERAQACFEEAMPLLQAHWQEISHYLDIPLKPNLAKYRTLEDDGVLRCYVVRRGTELVGYAVYVVGYNPHYVTSFQAIQDVLFLRKDCRGRTGLSFIAWCDDRLREEGVQAVYHHVKAAHNFGPALEHLGYELVDHIYARRLDGPIA